MCKEPIRSLFLRRGRFVLETGRDHRLKEWHHGTQFRAELLDGVLLLALTRGEEVGAALFIFFDPGFRKAAVADLRKDLAHFFSRLLGDDARSSGIITLFGSITDGVAHVAEATTVNQVDDQLELMEAFEVGNLGLIACFRERFEGAERQVVAVAKLESHDGVEIWLKGVAILLRLVGARNGDLDTLPPAAGFRGGVPRQAFFSRLGPRGPPLGGAAGDENAAF